MRQCQISNLTFQIQSSNFRFQIGKCQAAVSSSGAVGNCQKSGFVIGNAMPASIVRLRLVPRKTTWQSCSCCVSVLVSSSFCPFLTGTLSKSNAPFAFTCSVWASSWKGSFPCPWPYTYTGISSDQRRLLRRSGISTARSAGAFPDSFPERTSCACLSASKIRLICVCGRLCRMTDHTQTKYRERS